MCNAHYLRELTFVEEQEGEKWAAQMKHLLLRANRAVESYIEQGFLSPEVLLQIESEYTKILKDGVEYHALLPALRGKKGGRQNNAWGRIF